MINTKADSTVVMPVPAFVVKFIFWNTALHFLQFVFILTDMISSKGAVPLVRLNGTIVGWFMTTILLLIVALIAVRWKIIGRTLMVLVYLGVCLYNLIRDVHWHLFGGILTYSRFSEGATRILLEGAPQGEIQSVLDGYLLFEICLVVACFVCAFLPLPRFLKSISGRRSFRRLGLIVLALSVLPLLVHPPMRADTLWGFVNDLSIFSNETRSSFYRDRPLRVLLPEKEYIPQRNSHQPLPAALPEKEFKPKRYLHQPLRAILPEKEFVPQPQVPMPPTGSRPNVLIIILESFSAVYFSFYGYSDGVPMENIEALANTRALVGFRHYSVHGGSSHGSDWAILTGLYPESFGETPFHGEPWVREKTAFSYFKDAGYATGAFYSGDATYREHYKLFRHSDCDLFLDDRSTEFKQLSEKITPEQRAIRLMFQEIDQLNRKPFLYLYRTDNGHWPYKSRRGSKDLAPLVRYRYALAEVDIMIGEIVSGLKQRGLFNDTIIVLTSDHGESFRQHENLSLHSEGVYEELVHVPLVISNARLFEQNIQINTITSHIDILPTLLDMVGLAPKDLSELEGYSLIRSLPPDRMLFVSNGDDSTIAGILQNQYKLILKKYDSAKLLFDIVNDPLERMNLAKDNQAVVDRLTGFEDLWKKHRLAGIGESRMRNRGEHNNSGFLLSGNVDADIFLNGNKLVTVSNTKELLLPLDFQEGRNIILITGVAGYRSPDTGLYVKVFHDGFPIGTGPWWELASRRQLFDSPGSPAEKIDPKAWMPATIENKLEKDYTGDRYLDWIQLHSRQPFLLRLDFEVKDRKILTDYINIRGGHRFDFYINNKFFGSGRKTYWDHTHSFVFPQMKDNLNDIGIAVEAEPDEIGLMVEGSIGGRRIKTNSYQWQCIDYEIFRDQEKGQPNKGILKWQPAEKLMDTHSIGQWLPDVEVIWAANRKDGHFLFRYNGNDK